MSKRSVIKILTATTSLSVFATVITSCSCNDAKPLTTKFTVKFDSQGGPSVPDVTVEKGKTITKPADPVWKDHDFIGWYTTKECTGPSFDFTAPITSALTLYAKWIAASEFTIKFDTKGGSTIPDAKVAIHGTVKRPTNPTKPGHVFVDWYEIEDYSTNPFDFNTPITKSMTLYAKWRETQHCVVAFDSRGGTHIRDAEVEEGTTMTQPIDPTYQYHTFDGWYEDSGYAGYPFDFAQPITKSMTLYAKWTHNKATVTFNAKGGSPEPEPKEVNQGETITEPEQPTKEGYEFGGWYDNEECSGDPFDFYTPITADIFLYAKWIPNQITVTFDSKGGSPVESQTVDYGQSLKEPEPPTRPDYTFDGWYEKEDCSGEKYSFSKAVTKPFTLYAKWIADTYTVHFNTMGGSTIPDAKVAKRGKVARPTPDPTKSGSIFGGWYDNEECTGNQFDFDSTTIEKETTLYAKWNTYVAVTSIQVKGTIPSVKIGETTSWKIDDYIEVLPENATNKNLIIQMTSTEEKYIKLNADHTFTVIGLPDSSSTQELISLTIKSEDNQSATTASPLTYTPVTQNNFEVRSYNPTTGGYGIRPVDKELCTGDITIPANIVVDSTTYPVESIETEAFYSCVDITSLKFDETDHFKTIGIRAFCNCRGLSSVVLPNSITEIEMQAFAIPEDSTGYAPQLESINLPSSLQILGSNAFLCQSSLRSIKIPASTKTIGGACFKRCTALTNVEIEDSSQLTFIGNLAFAGCEALTSVSQIPKTVVKDVNNPNTTGLGAGVFKDCGALATIDIHPDNPSYKTIDASCGNAVAAEYVIDGTSYYELYVYPKAAGEIDILDDWQVHSIGTGCFFGKNITKVILPSTLLRIRAGAFTYKIDYGTEAMVKVLFGSHYNKWAYDIAGYEAPKFLDDTTELDDTYTTSKHNIEILLTYVAQGANLIRTDV